MEVPGPGLVFSPAGNDQKTPGQGELKKI